MQTQQRLRRALVRGVAAALVGILALLVGNQAVGQPQNQESGIRGQASGVKPFRQPVRMTAASPPNERKISFSKADGERRGLVPAS